MEESAGRNADKALYQPEKHPCGCRGRKDGKRLVCNRFHAGEGRVDRCLEIARGTDLQLGRREIEVCRTAGSPDALVRFLTLLLDRGLKHLFRSSREQIEHSFYIASPLPLQ